MNRSFVFGVLLLAAPIVHAQSNSSGATQYISDDVAVVLRESPSNDGASIGTLHSGDKVTVLESLGQQSFARVRTGDGREGWMTARYLSAQPAAKDRLQKMKADLDAAQAEIKSLQDQLKSAQAQLEKVRPAFELAQDNDRLKAELATKEQAADAAMQKYDHERAQRATLLTGAALLAGGVILGLVLPALLQNRRRRRYGDF
ncbi:TIGR04211 family SH3 domain-containing protein [Solimonas soli]|uniref:TIGR04211 family SH3 domain-containing protein n=1 Tax=Solimonas soli TaxID=413479 RepID=UPI00048335A1|nr:TIGR04211 family SH3 domain-containing protein [Solimonas soli]